MIASAAFALGGVALSAGWMCATLAAIVADTRINEAADLAMDEVNQ